MGPHFCRIGVAVVLTMSLVVAAGCGGGNQGCVSTQIPASWTSLGITAVDGGSVCTYSDEWVSVEHPGIEFIDLYGKYKQSLESAGWKVGEMARSSSSFDATKGDARLSVQYRDCAKSLAHPSTWSQCTDAVMQKR